MPRQSYRLMTPEEQAIVEESATLDPATVNDAETLVLRLNRCYTILHGAATALQETGNGLMPGMGAEDVELASQATAHAADMAAKHLPNVRKAQMLGHAMLARLYFANWQRDVEEGLGVVVALLDRAKGKAIGDPPSAH